MSDSDKVIDEDNINVDLTINVDLSDDDELIEDVGSDRLFENNPLPPKPDQPLETENPIIQHDDVKMPKRLSIVQINLFLLWQDNFRIPDEIIAEYRKRWPTDRTTATNLMQDLRRLKKATLAFSRENMRDQLMFEYEIMFKEANQAWLDSKEDTIVVIETHQADDRGDKHTITEKRTPQNGDSAHFRNALQVLQQIRDMTGVDEPKRIETIMKREIDLILQFFEQVLKPETFGEVMNALVQYEAEKGELI